MLSTTGTSNGSLMLWGRNSTSKKLHTTDGVIPHSVGKCPEGTKGTNSKAVQMVQNLEGLGFTVIPFGQGFRDMSPPSKEFYKLLLAGNIQHGGNPILRWMAGNVVTRSDPAQNIKPDKAKSTEKIDGIVATIMALDRAIRHSEEQTCVYDERELLVLSAQIHEQNFVSFSGLLSPPFRGNITLPKNSRRNNHERKNRTANSTDETTDHRSGD